MYSRAIGGMVIVANLLSGIAIAAVGGTVDGVFGVSNVPGSVSIAVWIPLDSGEAISGLRWYNNDQYSVFPRVRAMAGAAVGPDDLAGAVVIATEVSGASSSWSELQFVSPIASASDGLYVLFDIGFGGELVSRGDLGGCGVGYTKGDGRVRCWTTDDGSQWDALSSSYQMAVVPVVEMDKSAGIVMLSRHVATEDDEIEPAVDRPRPAGTSICARPNPFNPTTELHYSVQAAGCVSLAVYDVRGRAVRILVQELQGEGEYSVLWDGRDNAGRRLSSGTYLVHLRAGTLHRTERVTLLK